MIDYHRYQNIYNYFHAIPWSLLCNATGILSSELLCFTMCLSFQSNRDMHQVISAQEPGGHLERESLGMGGEKRLGRNSVDYR